MDVTALLRRNADYAQDFALGDLPAPPALRIAIVTCMDARIDPARALNLSEGDAHVIRNAGGVVTDDVIRSLSISQHELRTEVVMLVHHTRCGMQTFTDEDFASAREASGQRPPWAVRTFTDLEEDVRDSIRLVLDSPFVPHKQHVYGFVYEVESGLMREVTL